MKALTYIDKNNIAITEKPIPTIQQDRDAIIKVKMSSICTSDLHIVNGVVPKAKKGITLGHEFVGEIIELGKNVNNFNVGDRVSINCETFCGKCYFCKKGYINNCEKGGWKLGCEIDGCQAEYVRVPFADTGLTKLPENVSYKNALFVGDILSSGYFGAELCNIKKNNIVGVIGCGPVGLCAMQCAKIMGASKIIALDINNTRLQFAKNNNFADVIINPNKENYIETIHSHTLNRGVDCVIECGGTNKTFEMSWQIARANAIVAIVAMYENPQIIPLPDMYGKNLTFKTGGVDAIHCEKLLKLISQNKLNTDFLISKEIKLSEIIKGYELFQDRTNNLLKITIIPD